MQNTLLAHSCSFWWMQRRRRITLRQLAAWSWIAKRRHTFLAIIRVCPQGSEIAWLQKSREKEHRGGEGADKKKAIHYSDWRDPWALLREDKESMDPRLQKWCQRCYWFIQIHRCIYCIRQFEIHPSYHTYPQNKQWYGLLVIAQHPVV